MSGVVLGGVAEVVGSNLARGKNLQHLSAQLVHYIPLYIYIKPVLSGHCQKDQNCFSRLVIA